MSPADADRLLEIAQRDDLMYYAMLLLVVECDLKEQDLYDLDVADFDQAGARVFVDDLSDFVPAARIAGTLSSYVQERRRLPHGAGAVKDRDAFFVARTGGRLSKRTMRGRVQKYRKELQLPAGVKLERLRHSVLQRPSFWRGGPQRQTATVGGPDPIRRERERRVELFENLALETDLDAIAERLAGTRVGNVLIDRRLVDELGGKGPAGFAIAADLRTSVISEVTESYAIATYPAGPGTGVAVDALKGACLVRLPILALCDTAPIARGGWVENWDDSTRLWLIGFGDNPAPLPDLQSESEDFELEADRDVTIVSEHLAYAREPRFKFEAIRWYGANCAVCGISAVHVLQGAHIRPVRARGSDDRRNALVLCATHHKAFDAGLFAIAPDLSLVTSDKGPSLSDLRITMTSISHLARHPHERALEWHWTQWTADHSWASPGS